MKEVMKQMRLVLGFPFLVVFVITGVIFEWVSGERIFDAIKEV